MDELKLCPVPWCERVNKPEFYNPEPKAYCVACPDCGLETNVFATEAEAIAAWNTRAEAISAEPVATKDHIEDARGMVTQADREAYLALSMLPEFDAVDVRAGRWDKTTGLRAFAAHRIASDRAGYERGQREAVARIVAWIRTGAMFAHTDQEMADAIEAGEWK